MFATPLQVPGRWYDMRLQPPLPSAAAAGELMCPEDGGAAYALPSALKGDGWPALERPLPASLLPPSDVMHQVAENGQTDMLRALIVGCPQRLLERHRRTGHLPLACAVAGGNIEHVRLILSAMHHYGLTGNHTLEAVGYDERDALRIAIEADAVFTVDLLLAGGVDPRITTEVIKRRRLFSASPVRLGVTENAASFTMRKKKWNCLHKLLVWDEAQPAAKQYFAYAFDVETLVTQTNNANNVKWYWQKENHQISMRILQAARNRRKDAQCRACQPAQRPPSRQPSSAVESPQLRERSAHAEVYDVRAL
jgi:hypothetical protein